MSALSVFDIERSPKTSFDSCAVLKRARRAGSDAWLAASALRPFAMPTLAAAVSPQLHERLWTIGDNLLHRHSKPAGPGAWTFDWARLVGEVEADTSRALVRLRVAACCEVAASESADTGRRLQHDQALVAAFESAVTAFEVLHVVVTMSNGLDGFGTTQGRLNGWPGLLYDYVSGAQLLLHVVAMLLLGCWTDAPPHHLGPKDIDAFVEAASIVLRQSVTSTGVYSPDVPGNPWNRHPRPPAESRICASFVPVLYAPASRLQCDACRSDVISRCRQVPQQAARDVRFYEGLVDLIASGRARCLGEVESTPTLVRPHIATCLWDVDELLLVAGTGLLRRTWRSTDNAALEATISDALRIVDKFVEDAARIAACHPPGQYGNTLTAYKLDQRRVRLHARLALVFADHDPVRAASEHEIVVALCRTLEQAQLEAASIPAEPEDRERLFGVVRRITAAEDDLDKNCQIGRAHV